MKRDGFGIGEVGKISASTPLDEFEAVEMQLYNDEPLVECDCGHIIPKSLVMWSGSGTSCPDCYDDMSE